MSSYYDDGFCPECREIREYHEGDASPTCRTCGSALWNIRELAARFKGEKPKRATLTVTVDVPTGPEHVRSWAIPVQIPLGIADVGEWLDDFAREWVEEHVSTSWSLGEEE